MMMVELEIRMMSLDEMRMMSLDEMRMIGQKSKLTNASSLQG